MSLLKLAPIMRPLMRGLTSPRRTAGVLACTHPRYMSTNDRTFIDVSRQNGSDALKGAYPHIPGRFDECLAGMEVENIHNGVVEASIVVDEKLQNAFNTVHGGAVMTLVDVLIRFGTQWAASKLKIDSISFLQRIIKYFTNFR